MVGENDYIIWYGKLSALLHNNGIEFSDYDEFHIETAIRLTEDIIKEHKICALNITESMIDEYTKSAIQNNPDMRNYFETVACYVKKRILRK